MINFVDDLDGLFDADELAVEVIYNGRKIPAYFDAGFMPVNMGTLEVEGIGPTLTVKAADVVGVGHDDVFTVPVRSGDTETLTRYKVIEPQPDGQGVTVLILVKE